jgi:hypothetical protein
MRARDERAGGAARRGLECEKAPAGFPAEADTSFQSLSDHRPRWSWLRTLPNCNLWSILEQFGRLGLMRRPLPAKGACKGGSLQGWEACMGRPRLPVRQETMGLLADKGPRNLSAGAIEAPESWRRRIRMRPPTEAAQTGNPSRTGGSGWGPGTGPFRRGSVTAAPRINL